MSPRAWFSLAYIAATVVALATNLGAGLCMVGAPIVAAVVACNDAPCVVNRRGDLGEEEISQ